MTQPVAAASASRMNGIAPDDREDGKWWTHDEELYLVKILEDGGYNELKAAKRKRAIRDEILGRWAQKFIDRGYIDMQPTKIENKIKTWEARYKKSMRMDYDNYDPSSRRKRKWELLDRLHPMFGDHGSSRRPAKKKKNSNKAAPASRMLWSDDELSISEDEDGLRVRKSEKGNANTKDSQKNKKKNESTDESSESESSSDEDESSEDDTRSEDSSTEEESSSDESSRDKRSGKRLVIKASKKAPKSTERHKKVSHSLPLKPETQHNKQLVVKVSRMESRVAQLESALHDIHAKYSAMEHIMRKSDQRKIKVDQEHTRLLEIIARAVAKSAGMDIDGPSAHSVASRTSPGREGSQSSPLQSHSEPISGVKLLAEAIGQEDAAAVGLTSQLPSKGEHVDHNQSSTGRRESIDQGNKRKRGDSILITSQATTPDIIATPPQKSSDFSPSMAVKNGSDAFVERNKDMSAQQIAQGKKGLTAKKDSEASQSKKSAGSKKTGVKAGAKKATEIKKGGDSAGLRSSTPKKGSETSKR